MAATISPKRGIIKHMNLLLHTSTTEQLNSLAAKPGGTIMFHGPSGTGKTASALEFARRINCQGCNDQSCKACIMIRSRNHPDIILVEPDEKGKIGIEAIHQLQHDLQFREFEASGQRVVIIAGSETLTLPAQNALLKTLEEPPASTTVLLTASNPAALLETINSRCRQIYFPALTKGAISQFLTDKYSDREQSALAAELCGGSIALAIRYMNDEDYRDTISGVDERASTLCSARLFERLQVATKAAADLQNQTSYIEHLMMRSRQSAGAAHNLPAVDNLRRRLASNVAPKAAFEAFAVEVVC